MKLDEKRCSHVTLPDHLCGDPAEVVREGLPYCRKHDCLTRYVAARNNLPESDYADLWIRQRRQEAVVLNALYLDVADLRALLAIKEREQHNEEGLLG